MARVRYNVMLSEDENTYANDEWSRLLPDIRHNATVDLDAVFGEFQLINPRAKSFLCVIKAAFITLDIDMADELIRKRERSLKGAARAKLSRTKEFDHSKWVGGGMLDYRFSNARKYLERILKCFHLVLEKMLTGCRRISYSARKEEMPIRHLMSL